MVVAGDAQGIGFCTGDIQIEECFSGSEAGADAAVHSVDEGVLEEHLEALLQRLGVEGLFRVGPNPIPDVGGTETAIARDLDIVEMAFLDKESNGSVINILVGFDDGAGVDVSVVHVVAGEMVTEFFYVGGGDRPVKKRCGRGLKVFISEHRIPFEGCAVQKKGCTSRLHIRLFRRRRQFEGFFRIQREVIRRPRTLICWFGLRGSPRRKWTIRSGLGGNKQKEKKKVQVNNAFHSVKPLGLNFA